MRSVMFWNYGGYKFTVTEIIEYRKNEVIGIVNGEQLAMQYKDFEVRVV